MDESLSDMSIVHFDDSEPHSPMIGRNSSIFLVVRPAYPLIPELERDDWPVSVSMDAIPFCMTRGAYNVLTVALSSALALSLFFTAWVFSNLVKFVFGFYTCIHTYIHTYIHVYLLIEKCYDDADFLYQTKF